MLGLDARGKHLFTLWWCIVACRPWTNLIDKARGKWTYSSRQAYNCATLIKLHGSIRCIECLLVHRFETARLQVLVPCGSIHLRDVWKRGGIDVSSLSDQHGESYAPIQTSTSYSPATFRSTDFLTNLLIESQGGGRHDN